jgi:hypothetical protein
MQEANFLYNGKAKATSLCLMSLLESLENTIMKMGRDHRTITQNINFEHGIIMRCGDRNFRQVIAPMFGCGGQDLFKALRSALGYKSV